MPVLISWAIGFSIITLALFGAYFFFALQQLERNWRASMACSALLALLVTLQIFHWFALHNDGSLLSSPAYLLVLFCAPATFFLFVREMLSPNIASSPILLLHYLPAALPLLYQGPVAVTLAFLLGMFYGVWLCRSVLRLRAERAYFNAELSLLVAFILTALASLIVGLGAPIWGERTFVLSYAALLSLFVGITLFLVLKYPGFGAKAEEAIQKCYAVSTLKKSDTAQLKAKFDHLLCDQKTYRNESLSLASVAEALGISTHQLSELVNTEYGVGFSRLLRQARIQEAKTLLLAEPDTSILSVSMSVGFNSQSNFYTAFREIEGLTPGQFRKKHSK